MQLLVKLYDKTIEWSRHRHAERYLAVVSFIEASVFPIPPYFMLAPMSLARSDRAMRYALIATICSVLGGLVGYLLGYLVFKPIVLPVIEYFGYEQTYEVITAHFQEYSFLAVLLAGFLPIPFKIIAIAAGFMHVPVGLFMLAALFGRGAKFFDVAAIIKFCGVKMETHLRDMIAKSGFVFVIMICGFLGYKVLC